MLDNLRGFATTWAGKIIGAFLLLGLAGFGISGVLTGFGSNTVASVGDIDISIRDFQRAYNFQLNQVAQSRGAVPTSQEALALGLPSAAINRLAADAALTNLGREYGLGLSDQRLGQQLSEDPSFGSSFDTANFERTLRQNGFTENEYFADRTDAARRQQISIATFGGTQMPKAARTLLKRFTDDTRIVDFFIVSADSILPPADPTDGELATYLSENQQDFRTVPSRTARVMVLSTEAIGRSLDVGEDQLAEEYERTKANYRIIERRDVHQVVLNSDELVTRFEKGLADGETLDALIAEAGLSLTNLGSFTKAQMSDAKLAEAAFSVAEESFVLIPAILGTRAVAVSNVTAGGLQDFADVRDQVEQSVRNRLARDRYVDILDQIEELRASLQPLGQIASRFSLDLSEVTITGNGSELSAVADLTEDGYSRVAAAVFANRSGDLAPTVTLGTTRNVWFDLLLDDPARDQSLSEVKDELREQIIADRTNDMLLEEIDQINAALESGTSITDVALSRGLFPQTSPPLTRSGGATEVDARVASAAFGGPVGFYGSAANGLGDYVVFQVVEVIANDDEIDETAVEFINNSMINSMYAQFITGLRDDQGMHINQGTLNQILGTAAQTNNGGS